MTPSLHAAGLLANYGGWQLHHLFPVQAFSSFCSSQNEPELKEQQRSPPLGNLCFLLPSSVIYILNELHLDALQAINNQNNNSGIGSILHIEHTVNSLPLACESVNPYFCPVYRSVTNMSLKEDSCVGTLPDTSASAEEYPP